MKDKILMFIIGFLVGAIIVSCYFIFIDKKNINNNKIGNPQDMQPNNEQMKTPPEKVDGNIMMQPENNSNFINEPLNSSNM